MIILTLLIVTAVAGFPAYFFAKWLFSILGSIERTPAILLAVLGGLVSFALIFVGEVFVFFWIFPLQR